MDEGPIDAPYVTGSDLAQWASGATGGGLPEVEIRPHDGPAERLNRRTAQRPGCLAQRQRAV